MGHPQNNENKAPRSLVVSREELIRRQSNWLMFWTMVFLLTGLILGLGTSEQGTQEGGFWVSEHRPATVDPHSGR